MSVEKIYQKLYFGLCVFITILLTLWCVYEYLLDSEVSNVMLRQFNETPEDIQPSITLCDGDPFLNSKFSGQVLDEETFLVNYRNYIIGQEFNDLTNSISKFQNTDYDDVSSSLSDVLEQFSLEVLLDVDATFSVEYQLKENSLVAAENFSRYLTYPNFNTGMISTLKSLEHINVYISARNGNYKCYTFDIPWIKRIPIRRVTIEINAATASDASGIIDLGRYYVKLTYPNQTLQFPRGKRIYLNTHSRFGNCYRFKVTTGAMEVYHRRDKSEKRCNMDWKQQDQKFMNYIIEKSGCNPKHWNIHSAYDYCYEARGCAFQTKYLKLEFHLDKAMFYKEISEVKAYTFQSLIGNAGKI